MPSFEDRIRELGIEHLNEFTIAEFARISGHSPIYVHRAIHRGDYLATTRTFKIDEDFTAQKWVISIDTARAWYNQMKEDLEIKLQK